MVSHRGYIVLLAIVVLFLEGCGVPVATVRSLQGIVRDSSDAVPVRNCAVLAVPLSTHRPFITRTDQNGEYYFNRLPPGKYVVGFSSRGRIEGVFVEVLYSCPVMVDHQMGTSPSRSDVLQVLSTITPEALEADSVLQGP
jgi:hypothetical protein